MDGWDGRERQNERGVCYEVFEYQRGTTEPGVAASAMMVWGWPEDGDGEEERGEAKEERREEKEEK